MTETREWVRDNGETLRLAADTGIKTNTLEMLGDGFYALTVEGDPNVGAVEGEDFVAAIDRATPAASRDWLKILRDRTDKPVR